MPRVTIKSLQEEMESLKLINEVQSNEITKLNIEIDSLRAKEKIVTKEEYNFLLKQLEDQKLLTNEYRKLYEDLKDKHDKEHNKRNAGRKAYSNKETIEKIYNLYLEGQSLQGIANELNRLEIKTNRNKDWSKSSIRFILLNSKNVTNGFIEQAIFNRAVKLLNDNKKIKP